MKFFLVIILFSTMVFSKSSGILLLEKQKVMSTITSTTSNNFSASTEFYSLRYYLFTKNVFYLVGVAHQPNQTVGNTSISNFPVEIKQKKQKVELGVAYKYYLTNSLYVGPGIIYKRITSKTSQKINMNGTINTINNDDLDIDYGLYAVMGYQPSKSTSLLLSLTLNNDLLNSDYNNDFSDYQLNASILQAISTNVYLYVQYTQSLKDKPATTLNTGVKDSHAFSLGFAFKF